MSPACSFGVKENGARQFGQNPSGRPGRPARERPTGLPQFGQYRRSSGTSGLTMIAELGSITGADGTVVIPAPRRAPRNRLDVAPGGRFASVPRAAGAEPRGALASRNEDAVRVDPTRAEPTCP